MCFCDCVSAVVFLWWCGGVFVVVFSYCLCGGVFVFLWRCSCGGVFVVVFLWWCPPTSETTSERRPSSTTPYYASTTKASKTSISCEASATFHRKSFQNDRFVRGFLQISQNKLPKRAFRAMLPTIFTKNLRFATVSRNRHTASCERVHPPKAKCASHYNAVHSQISKCTFRYSGVHKNV